MKDSLIKIFKMFLIIILVGVFFVFTNLVFKNSDSDLDHINNVSMNAIAIIILSFIDLILYGYIRLNDCKFIKVFCETLLIVLLYSLAVSIFLYYVDAGSNLFLYFIANNIFTLICIGVYYVSHKSSNIVFKFILVSLSLMLLSSFIFHLNVKDRIYWEYDDKWMIGKTVEEVEDRYGSFDPDFFDEEDDCYDYCSKSIIYRSGIGSFGEFMDGLAGIEIVFEDGIVIEIRTFPL